MILEGVLRWLPAASVVFVLCAVLGNAARLRGPLGSCPIVVRSQSSRPEQALFLLGLAYCVFLVGGSLWPSWFRATSWFDPRPWTGLVGAAVLGLGFTVFLSAFAHLGTSWRVGIDRLHPQALVEAGVYAWIRHPIYTGVLCWFTGMALVTGSLVCAVAVLVAYVGVRTQADREERFLLDHHPDYAGYRRRTGRFVPGLGRSDPSS